MISSPALPISTSFQPVGKRILVVEDELLIRLALSDGLRDAGFQVIEACSADEALDLLESAVPDLVISDVRMPGSIDGLGLLAEIRLRHSDLPVIMVSGHFRPSHQPADGVTQFISKPYAMEVILQVIDANLDEAV